MQGERSELCDGGLKKTNREGKRERRGEQRRGGVARRKRVAHLAKAQQRAQRAKGQAMQGECNTVLNDLPHSALQVAFWALSLAQ